MTDYSNADQRPSRKPYVKPAVVQVSLRPEEAVLGACKRAGTSGPGQPTCVAPAPCSSPAS